MANNNKGFLGFLSNMFGGGMSVSPPVNLRQRVKGYTKLDPETSQRSYSLDYSRNFSHNLFVNSAPAIAVGNAFRHGVLGSGVRLRSEVKNKHKDRTTGQHKYNERANERIEKDWKKWGKCCTVDGLLGWHEFSRKTLNTIIESGEAFIIMYDIAPENRIKGIKSNIPLSFQLLEGDMVDETYAGEITNAGDYWIEGIKYNKFGRPLSYAFKVVVNGLYETKIYDARNILHLFMADKLRPNARRGFPWLTPVVSTIDKLEAYMSSMLLYMEQSSSVNTYIVPEAGVGDTQGPQPEELYESVHNESNRGGGIRVLPPGSSVIERPQVGAAQLDPFIQASLRTVAMAVGLTYEALTLDFSKTNFSSGRLSNLVNTDRYNEVRTYLIENMFDVIYEKWLKAYLLTKPFDSLPSENPEDYNHTWSIKKQQYIDPTKALNASKTAYELGIVSKSTLAEDHGYDYASELKLQAQDIRAVAEAGLSQNPTEAETSS